MRLRIRDTDSGQVQMKKLDALAHLLTNPVLPKANRFWSGADVVIAFAPQPDQSLRSFHPRDRKVLTEHGLEVSYFFEVLREPFYEEAHIDHSSKIEVFLRLARAADACLREEPDATAHLVCAAVLREAYAMAKQIDEGEFASLLRAEGNRIGNDLTLAGQRTGFSSIKETIEFFRARSIQIYGRV